MRRRLRVVIALVVVPPLVAVAAFAIRFGALAPHESAATIERQIVHLTRERDSLRALVWETAAASDLLKRRPAGDVVIGLPVPLVTTLVQDAVTGWFHDVEVTLHDLHVYRVGDVSARLGILGRHRVGSYNLKLTLDEVRGRLEAGAPALTFGGDQIGVSLPVRVTGGSAHATIDVTWDSKGLADKVCGDLAVTRAVNGVVTPSEHLAVGRIVLTERGGVLVADPEFPDLAIRLFADPSAASVAVLDSLLQSKGGLCGMAIGTSKASDRIVALVGRGFNVKIPQRFFRPMRFPLAVETSVPVRGRSLALTVRLNGLAVTAATVWFGADVAIAPPR